jgi:hypothetical protein
MDRDECGRVRERGAGVRDLGPVPLRQVGHFRDGGALLRLGLQVVGGQQFGEPIANPGAGDRPARNRDKGMICRDSSIPSPS